MPGLPPGPGKQHDLPEAAMPQSAHQYRQYPAETAPTFGARALSMQPRGPRAAFRVTHLPCPALPASLRSRSSGLFITITITCTSAQYSSQSASSNTTQSLGIHHQAMRHLLSNKQFAKKKALRPAYMHCWAFLRGLSWTSQSEHVPRAHASSHAGSQRIRCVPGWSGVTAIS